MLDVTSQDEVKILWSKETACPFVI